MEKYWLNMHGSDFYGNHTSETLLMTDSLKDAVTEYCYWLGMGRTMTLYENKKENYYEGLASCFFPISSRDTISFSRTSYKEFKEILNKLKVADEFTLKQRLLMWAQTQSIFPAGKDKFKTNLSTDYEKTVLYTAYNGQLNGMLERDSEFIKELALI